MKSDGGRKYDVSGVERCTLLCVVHQRELLQRMEAEKKRHQAALREKVVEIQTMKRAALRDAQEIQRLGSAMEKADSTVRRQIEEIANLKNRQPVQQTPRSARSMSIDRKRQEIVASTDRLKYSTLERKTKRWLDVKIREVCPARYHYFISSAP